MRAMRALRVYADACSELSPFTVTVAVCAARALGVHRRDSLGHGCRVRCSSCLGALRSRHLTHIRSLVCPWSVAASPLDAALRRNLSSGLLACGARFVLARRYTRREIRHEI